MAPFLFPDLEPAPLEPDPPGAAERSSERLQPDDERQIPLFSDVAVLRRDLEHALAAGDFEEAGRVRARALEAYGLQGPAAGFEFLDPLGPDLWVRPAGVILDAWEELDRDVDRRPRIRSQLREGVFRRLLTQVPAAQLAATRPHLLGPLCAVLAATGGSTGFAEARSLVRDVLLEARELAGVDFAYDRPVSELLAEDRAPAWLACLGALRRLWPVPPAGADDLGAMGLGGWEPPPSHAAAALAFWGSLRVARTADRPEACLHEARRRMKRLDPDLHALYMGRGNGR